MIEVINYDPKHHEDLLEEFFQLPGLPERNSNKKFLHYDKLMDDGVLLLVKYKNKVKGMECCLFNTEDDGTYWAKFPWRTLHHKMPYFPRYHYEQKIYDEIAKRKITKIATFYNVGTDYNKRINRTIRYTQKHQKNYVDKLSDVSKLYLPYWKKYHKQVFESYTWSVPVYCNLTDGKWFLKREEKEINEEHQINFKPHTFY